MKHSDKHTCNMRLKNRRNITNMRLQHMCTNHMQHLDLLLQHLWNTYNISLKYLKRFKYTLATCASSKPWKVGSTAKRDPTLEAATAVGQVRARAARRSRAGEGRDGWVSCLRWGAPVLEKASGAIFFRSCKALKRIERSGVSGVCFPILLENVVQTC